LGVRVETLRKWILQAEIDLFKNEAVAAGSPFRATARCGSWPTSNDSPPTTSTCTTTTACTASSATSHPRSTSRPTTLPHRTHHLGSPHTGTA